MEVALLMGLLGFGLMFAVSGDDDVVEVTDVD
jgi:hypothetical protein